jgi:sporulation protein YlmC with PRC-barrel domain
MSTPETAAEHGVGLPVIHLSQLLHSPVLARSGEAVGRVEDVLSRHTAQRRR